MLALKLMSKLDEFVRRKGQRHRIAPAFGWIVAAELAPTPRWTRAQVHRSHRQRGSQYPTGRI